MKKLLVMLLALMLACGGVLAGAVAEEESPYQYTLRSDGTAEITCTDKSITCAKVPAELDGYKVTALAEDAFLACLNLKSITLPRTIRELGVCSISQCYSLKDLVLPNGLKTIKGQAFMYNIEMRSISIPASVTKIGDGVFNYCDKLKHVRISPSNRSYEAKGKLLIEKKTKKIISTIGVINGKYEIPYGIKTIASVAFQGNNNLTELTIPDTVKKIENLAFVNCNNLVCKVRFGSYAHKYCKDNGIRYVVCFW